jgi:hypothetical protein
MPYNKGLIMPLYKFSFTDFARCKGNQELNFNSELIEELRKAAHFCNECPVRQPCLDYSLRNNIRTGVWGGKLPTERLDLYA